MTNCTNCNGEGIVGGGDKPWLKEGALSTCQNCKGTGKLIDEAVQETPVVTPDEVEKLEEVTVPREEIVAELGEEAVAKIEAEAEPVVIAPETPNDIVSDETETDSDTEEVI